MSSIKTHLKLTIRDIYNCNVADDGSSFFCTLFSDNSKLPTAFSRVRLHGLVMQKNESSFVVDDGTGVIVVKTSQDSFFEIPKISEYVEVLGVIRIEGKSERIIYASHCSSRNEPMEELRFLLEQAAIHRDYHKYRQLTQQTFLSSETNTANMYDEYTNKVSDFFTHCDRSKGLVIDDILKLCDNNLNAAQQVIESLINNTEIYEQDGVYFPI